MTDSNSIGQVQDQKENSLAMFGGTKPDSNSKLQTTQEQEQIKQSMAQTKQSNKNKGTTGETSPLRANNKKGTDNR